MTQDMTTGSPFKLILQFAIPMLIGNIFQQFYNMVDAIVVGRFVGITALGAVGATASLNFLVFGFAMGFMAGFSVVISQRFGAGDEAQVRKAVTMSVLLAAVMSVILTVLAVANTRNLLTLMQTPEDIFDSSVAYISIMFSGFIVTVFYNLLSSIMRALGDSKTPLYFLILASFLNVILDLLFVAVFSWGVAGAAIATVFSQATSVVLCLLYMRKKYDILKMSREDWQFDMPMCGKLLSLGIPTALQTSVTAIGMMVLQGTINSFGSAVIAANTAASRVEQLVMQPLVSVGLSVATFTGQNLGAGKLDRIRKGLRVGVIIDVSWALLAGVLMTFGGDALTMLFVSNEDVAAAEVLRNSQMYLRTASMFFVMLALIFVYRNTLQGLGKPLIPMLSGFLELVMRITVALSLAGPLGYRGICYSNPAAWVGAGTLLVIACYINLGKLRKQYAAQEEIAAA